MTRTQRSGQLLVAGIALVLGTSAFERPAPVVENATIASVSRQLGVKVFGRADEEFGLGVQFTGLLVEPDSLAAYGIPGMRAGARVVAFRIAADRVYIEADELEPPRRASNRVAIDVNGRLVRPPKAASSDGGP